MFVYWIRLPEHKDITKQGYIGIAHNFEQRMFAHKSCAKTNKEGILYKAIQKYGWDNLIKEKLLFSDKEYCEEIEKKLRPKPRIGWNVAIGGFPNGSHLKGKKQSPEHLANRCVALKGRISGMKGKKHSEEAKQKVRLTFLGKPKTEESKRKNAEAHKQKICINNIIYESWQEASAKTGIPMGSFSYLLKNKVSSKSKYNWIYKIYLVM